MKRRKVTSAVNQWTRCPAAIRAAEQAAPDQARDAGEADAVRFYLSASLQPLHDRSAGKGGLLDNSLSNQIKDQFIDK